MLVGQPKSVVPGSFLDVWVPNMIDLSELAQSVVTSRFFGGHFTEVWLFACYLVIGKGKSFKIEFLGTKLEVWEEVYFTQISGSSFPLFGPSSSCWCQVV